ncbi:MAG: valine--tRNA ligase [Leptolyngbya sp. PLA1]|nr:valine--tRNA ligase [Leptolyngbya sp. PLA1]
MPVSYRPAYTRCTMPTPPSEATPQPSKADGTGPELPKQYRPADHERGIWDRWVAASAFRADPTRVLAGEARPYSLLIPPPNVTAALHLGHALNNTLQDILARAHRMRGFETLWMPGTDHAGIATQAVVEKRLRKEGKLRGALKQAYTRDAFVAEIQAFKDEYEAVITGQLKAMGCSCDWDRQRFTMDPICARAVREAFFRLFKDDLIYRGKRLVNWDPVLQTAVADDECYDEEIDGAFYYLRYPLVHAGATDPALAAGSRETDPMPVTWSELAARGYPGAEEQPVDAPAWITVATTRPETYLGDTAVAVNPQDPRAKALRGLFVELPLVGRVIPVIEDDYVVLPERFARSDEEKSDPKARMATGFLKVTPAHDPNDAEIGQRHNLAAINVMAPDGSISDAHGWTDVGDARLFVGKKREEARKMVVQEFKARTLGDEPLFERSAPHRHSVKHSDRSKAIVEPYLSDQWYVRVTDPRLAQAANDALVPEQRTSGGGKGPMRFFPGRYARTFEGWHDNIRDWCISRQLWWGHRIPVWVRQTGWDAPASPASKPSEDVLRKLRQWQDEGRVWFRDHRAGSSAADASISGERHDFIEVCVRHQGDAEIIDCIEADHYEQDPDVLDTWFSSALWPLSTLGWPDTAKAAADDPRAGGDFDALLRAFNPTTSLSTAREIITLWVSRMTMFNRYFRGQDLSLGAGSGPAPFRDVFIHAVIQDGEGRKMSKSLGNGVDPLDIIATHGSDAMRFTLATMATNTQDVRLPVRKDPATGKNTSEKFDLGRNFATKLWNAARFALEKLDAPPASGTVTPASLPDRWMLSRLARAIAECDAALANYEFSVYANTCYTLLWNDFCDWYLEAVKPTIASDPAQRAVLRASLDAILRLLHPVMPYVTEVLYGALSRLPAPGVNGLQLPAPQRGMLVRAAWPVSAPTLTDTDAEASFARVQALVSAVREVRAQLQVPFKRAITLHMPDSEAHALGPGLALVNALANIGAVTSDAPAGPSTPITIEGREYRLSNLADQIDAGAEKDRLTRLVADLTKSKATLEGRLANPGYAQKAPPHMVQQTKDQLAKAEAELAAASTALEALG